MLDGVAKGTSVDQFFDEPLSTIEERLFRDKNRNLCPPAIDKGDENRRAAVCRLCAHQFVLRSNPVAGRKRPPEPGWVEIEDEEVVAR